jgi:DNA modification methylase
MERRIEGDRLGPYLLGPNDTPENGIYTGDARELSKAIPDESVDLIFTDPVYDRIEDYAWLAETAARVLNETGNLLVYCWNEALNDIFRIDWPLFYKCTIAHYHPGRVKPKFSVAGFNLWTPILWMSRLENGRVKWRDAFQTMPKGLKNRVNQHKWAKPPDAIVQGITGLTKRHDVTFDPFTGGGTVPAVCKMLGRKYLAFEIDPDTAEDARKRVRQTQPPMTGWVEQMAQLELNL